MVIPPTTRTIERSFSTLSRVKPWLRSTMMEQRLSGICMLSIHRQVIKNFNFVENVVNALNVIYN